ncbi:MAG: hypothetical protein GXP29_03485 [Planctomycetes bacterium]|nr:hypothetical protein [Planctomycetota bacterium]
MKLWKVSVLLAAVAMFAVPANAQDTCATAVPAPGPVNPSNDASPDDEGLAAGSTCAGGTLDSWVTFVATETTHRIRTDIGSGGTDSEIGIYSGSCGSLVEVNCNNDECFNGVNFCPSLPACSGDSGGPWMSSACTSGLTIGATYYVRVTTFGDLPNGDYSVTVEGSGGTCGDGAVACDGSEECEADADCPNGGVCNGCVCEMPCPATCAGAIDIGNYSNCGAGAAEGATLVDPCCDTDPTGPLGSCTSGGGGNDVWLSFVASAAGIRIRTDAASIGTDSDFIVYSGTCGALTEVGCSEDGAGASGYLGDINVVGLTPGETYLVQLGGWNDSCGPFGVTTEAIPGSVCGDGIRAGIVGEDCDPGDGGAIAPDDGNCIGLCAADCSCPTPVCGNGVQEVGEQCDEGAGNGAVGCILPDCTCTGDCKIATDIVPAVSEWGLVVMVLIGLAAGTVMFGRKRVIA